MKKIIVATSGLLFFVASLKAQTLKPATMPKAALKVIKKEVTSTNTKVEANGQSMLFTQDATTKTEINLPVITATGAIAEIKTKALKMTSTGMGQEKTYDSENPAESDEEMAKMLKDKLSEIVKVSVDAKGIITDVSGKAKAKDDDENEKGLGSNEFKKGKLFDVFFEISKAVKPGDKWKDSTTTKEGKEVIEYEYKSYFGGEATIAVTSTFSNKEGMEGKMQSTATVDATTMLFKTRTTNGSITAVQETPNGSIPVNIALTVKEIFTKMP